MIRAAKNCDIQLIRELWKLSFDDNDEYLDMYFAHRFCAEFTPLLFVDGKLVAMVHLLPCEIFPKKKAFYWYAVCVHPDFRGKGYFKYLLKTVLKGSQRAGFANVCLPASGLISLYQKNGFIHSYYSIETFYSNFEKNADIVIKKADYRDFLKKMIPKSGSLCWNDTDIQYAIIENEFCDGTTISFKYKNCGYVALAVKKNDFYVLENTNINSEVADAVQGNILQFLNTKKFLLRENESDCICGKKVVFGLSDQKDLERGASITFTLA